MRNILVLAASVGLVLSQCSTSAPQVTTLNGVVEGFCQTDSPVQINAFLGVPFAEPPARFTKPQPKNNWSGVLATKTQPNMCIQQTTDPNSEDCLYLNIYTPAIAPAGGNPVFVVVHGGAFASGSAGEGTPQHISKNLAAKGLVVVSIQYRTGPLGFCTTKDSVLPGNYGMWDAKIAFEWIRDNIAAFGGNPNDVTAYGGSAGAALIDGMHLSPLTTNLFHKMALFSGVSANMWDAKTKENCEARATSIGLTWTDSASFKAALLSANASSLAGGWRIILEDNFDAVQADWSPVYDGDFFPTTNVLMRAATQPKPTIYGISFLEGASTSGALTIDHDIVERVVNYMAPVGIPNRTEFKNYFLEAYRNQATILEPTAIDKHALQAAFGERTRAATIDAVVRRNFDLFGANQTAWRYVFKHFNPATTPRYPFVSFASHAYDQWYSIGLPGFTFAGDDQTVVDTYTNALVNFAKTGNPNGSGATALPVEWKMATPENPSLNYVIETVPFMDPQFFLGRPNLNNVLNRLAGTFRAV